MEIIKKLYPRKEDGKLIPCYFVSDGEHKPVMIKPVFEQDWGILNYLSRFVGVKQNDKTSKKDN